LLVPSIDLFNLPVFLFITPMFLFGGTFFPVENLPLWAKWTALLLPLTHLVNLARAFTTGHLDASLLVGIAYLTLFAAATLPIAIGKMRRRLIK
ncbi:MAG: ABC transporter permease, partial [Deltaproteobacteria bacterium]|nr:ABC transporter permease [Deltaproteobacteria bacterium]